MRNSLRHSMTDISPCDIASPPPFGVIRDSNTARSTVQYPAPFRRMYVIENSYVNRLKKGIRHSPMAGLPVIAGRSEGIHTQPSAKRFK